MRVVTPLLSLPLVAAATLLGTASPAAADVTVTDPGLTVTVSAPDGVCLLLYPLMTHVLMNPVDPEHRPLTEVTVYGADARLC